MITCRELVDFLDDYFAGNQPKDVREAFEAHLAACPPCKQYLQTYRDTIHLTRSLCTEGRDEPPCEVPDRLIEAILLARRQSDAGTETPGSSGAGDPPSA